MLVLWLRRWRDLAASNQFVQEAAPWPGNDRRRDPVRTSQNPTAQSWRSPRSLETPGESATGGGTAAIRAFNKSRPLLALL